MRRDALRLMSDLEAWNSTPSDQRAAMLLGNNWLVYNQIVAQLSPDEHKVLQTHPSFRPLRILFTRAMASNGDVELAIRTTDALYDAVKILRGSPL